MPTCYSQGLKYKGARGRGLSPQLLAKPAPAQGECGGRVKEGIRKRGKR